MKNKLKLSSIAVNSFVTEITLNKGYTIKGGSSYASEIDEMHCEVHGSHTYKAHSNAETVPEYAP